MNQLKKVLAEKKKNLLAIYFTAGYPNLNDTSRIIKFLDKEGVDIIEVGVPYSDPLADGPTIQETGSKALANGMKLDLLFKQLDSVKKEISTPLVLMGYFNQFLQYGPEIFLKRCHDVGVSGLILPDMPLAIYEQKYKSLFEQYNQTHTFLVTPRTPDERVKKLAAASSGFLYIVSSVSTTGAKSSVGDNQLEYFKRIKALNLPQSQLIGFGISNKETYQIACSHSNGAIIGSAFLKALKGVNLEKEVIDFIQSIR